MTPPLISFFVPGKAKTAGSKSGFAFKGKDGRLHVRMVDSSDKPRKGTKNPMPNQGKIWRAAITATCIKAMAGMRPLTGPIRLDCLFLMKRAKNHYGTGKNESVLKPAAPRFHTIDPDRTKMLRAAEDALKGIAWVDDNQVVGGPTEKRYAEIGEEHGVKITISPADRPDRMFTLFDSERK